MTEIIDLRSDTVTRPTDAMHAAMRSAELGDDVLGDDPTVKALERKISDLLGKEAALFTPSGTMANQLAIRSICEGGDEIIAHRDSHIIHYETGGPAALSGCMISMLEGDGGIFTADDINTAMRGVDDHNPFDRMLVVENTHNRGGGIPWRLEDFEDVAFQAGKHGLHVHVDGARLFNAVAACGYDARTFATSADSVSVCFSKGLGAPVGSALVGPEKMITRARRFRKMLGGSMRQAGMLAAAAIHALDHHLERLVEDHENAKLLARKLQDVPGIALRLDPEDTPTNMVFFTLEETGPDAARYCEELARDGVQMIPLGPYMVRAVTHLDVDQAQILQASDVCRRVSSSLGMTSEKTPRS